MLGKERERERLGSGEKGREKEEVERQSLHPREGKHDGYGGLQRATSVGCTCHSVSQSPGPSAAPASQFVTPTPLTG